MVGCCPAGARLRADTVALQKPFSCTSLEGPTHPYGMNVRASSCPNTIQTNVEITYPIAMASLMVLPGVHYTQ